MSLDRRIQRLEKTIPIPPENEWPPEYRTPMHNFSCRSEAQQDLIAFYRRAMTDYRATSDQKESFQEVIDWMLPKLQHELERDRERKLGAERREGTAFN